MDDSPPQARWPLIPVAGPVDRFTLLGVATGFRWMPQEACPLWSKKVEQGQS